MPMVLALTAKPMAAGRHLIVAHQRGQDGLGGEQVDHREKRREPDHQLAHEGAAACRLASMADMSGTASAVDVLAMVLVLVGGVRPRRSFVIQAA